MKLYTCSEFLKLPAGTLFLSSPDDTWQFGSLCVKGETVTEHPDAGVVGRVFQMLEIDGLSYTEGDQYDFMHENPEASRQVCDRFEFSCPKDGRFFLVFEFDDVRKLEARVKAALDLLT